VLKLSASGSGTDQGTYNVTALAGPPVVTLVVPTVTSGFRALVRTRQPVIRAAFATNGASIDTAATVLRWRGEVVTNLSRHNRALLEWEVDSTRWLAVGDSALIEVTACGTSGGCTTATRWAILLNGARRRRGVPCCVVAALASFTRRILWIIYVAILFAGPFSFCVDHIASSALRLPGYVRCTNVVPLLLAVGEDKLS
jgi:hypothetical protein